MHVLWLLTSRERVAEHRHYADRLMRELPASVSVRSFDEPPQLTGKSKRPAAVIFSVPSSDRGQPGVGAWADVCLRTTTSEATFGTFVLAATDPARAAEDGGETTFTALSDVARTCSLETLPSVIEQFLRDLPDASDGGLRRSRKSMLVRGSGRAAELSLLVAGAIAIGTFMPGLGSRAFVPNGVVTLAQAFALAVLGLVILGGRAKNRRLDREQSLAILGWCLVMWSISLRPFGPRTYVWLGLLAGVLAEYCRRAGVRERASLIKVEPMPEAEEGRAVQA